MLAFLHRVSSAATVVTSAQVPVSQVVVQARCQVFPGLLFFYTYVLNVAAAVALLFSVVLPFLGDEVVASRLELLAVPVPWP